GNMHLMPEFGMTVNEITGAGFKVDAGVPLVLDDDSERARARAMGAFTAGMADALGRLQPDAAIMLGDRYEMLAAASAAAVMHIPVVHIAGGEISEGAIDDSFRHAITKLSTLHLTATEDYRRRVIQMGEQPDRVINTGAIGVWNAMNIAPLPIEALEEFLDINLHRSPALLVTYHPATNDTSANPADKLRCLFDALDSFEDCNIIITHPNNDAGGLSLLPLIQDYAAQHADRVRSVASLGMLRYQSLLRHVKAVVGNSSSGIVEAPSAGVPTVDIGIRQRGRLAGPSVIHCADDSASIISAIREALSDSMQTVAAKRENPYYRPDTLRLMTSAVLDFIENMPQDVTAKKFHDL
ncbi:MAG: UDP-N-acetylglucosamine 2-epimerase (hydrolyzing), partial [Muribaculaceae bacterium]|nr:UDP-N-acetylglucosamine 2-epimerase (hydrolyzing) [Muribaculaceae bacterium]